MFSYFTVAFLLASAILLWPDTHYTFALSWRILCHPSRWLYFFRWAHPAWTVIQYTILCDIWGLSQKSFTLTTLRLRVSCSTDWASRANTNMHFIIIILNHISDILILLTLWKGKWVAKISQAKRKAKNTTKPCQHSEHTHKNTQNRILRKSQLWSIIDRLQIMTPQRERGGAHSFSFIHTRSNTSFFLVRKHLQDPEVS